jgi:subtilisin family serine protease
MTASPWISDRGAGTSYAAPVVAGEAALLMQQQSALKTWPETVKAIIMASAVHNIQGESRLSDKDGAGAVDASEAIDTVVNSRYQSATLTSTSFPQSHTVYLQAGQKVRAVASWDSLPANAHPPTSMTDTLNADLDLVVYNPSGSFVTNSNSWDNNYEIVEFTASTTGNYNIRLDKSRFAGTSERVGFAYTIYT